MLNDAEKQLSKIMDFRLLQALSPKSGHLTVISKISKLYIFHNIFQKATCKYLIFMVYFNQFYYDRRYIFDKLKLKICFTDN